MGILLLAGRRPPLNQWGGETGNIMSSASANTKRSAFVTGGAAGIGFEIAALLCDRGYDLTIVDLSPRALSEARRRLERRRPHPAVAVVRAERCDVADAPDLAAAVRRHAARHGGMDVMVNNAGIAERGDFADPAEASNWRAVVGVDLAAAIDGTRLGVGVMGSGGGGVVINVASAGGIFPMPFSPVYSAAKAGLVMFCRSMAAAVADQGIAVRAFCPQFVDTAFVKDSSEELARVHKKRSSSTGGDQQGLGSVPTHDDLVKASGGRLLTVAETALACVENLVDKPPHSHASTTLLLTTRGVKWWSFDGAAGRQRRQGKEMRSRL